jgi:hypothetical protein
MRYPNILQYERKRNDGTKEARYLWGKLYHGQILTIT